MNSPLKLSPAKSALTLLLGAVSVALAQPTTLPSLTIPDGFGVNIHFTRANAEELKVLGESGARFIRMDFGWGGIERTRGEYNFSAYDGLVADMAKLGIRCLFIFDYANRLYDDGQSPHSEEGRAAFARFAAAGAKHFAGKGVLWEIWNEPNIGFWKPKPNVEDYSSLALATIDAVRAADPNAFIMGPASSEFPWSFFEVMGKRGVFAKLNAVSVHPYRQTDPEAAEADYARLRALIDRYAPGRNLPIISGEWGYSTAWKGMTEEKQANYIVRQRLLNLSLQVPVSIWYDWKDDGPDPKEPEHHFGTVYRDLKPKPSLIAGKVLAETLAGYQFVRRVAAENPKDYVLLFSKGTDQVALAAWTMAEPHAANVGHLPMDQFTAVSRDGNRSTSEDHAIETRLDLAASPRYLLLAKSEGASHYASWRPMQTFNLIRPARKNTISIATASSGTFAVSVAQQVIGKLSVNVVPGVEQVIAIPVEFARADQPATLATITWYENSNAFPQSALIWLLPANPLHASILPPAGNAVTALIDNPSGQATNLKLRLIAGGATAESTLKIDPGQEQGSAILKLPAAPAADAPLRLDASDSAGQLLLSSSAVRWAPTAFLAPNARWRATIDGDKTLQATATVAIIDLPSPPQAGLTKALNLSYQFPNGWKYIALMPPESAAPIDGKPQSLGLWVNGDASGNILRCRFKDSTGQVFQPHYGPITWSGWKWITLPLAGQNLFHWAGANDGVIHYPIRWDAPLLVDNGKLKINEPLTIQAAGFALGY